MNLPNKTINVLLFVRGALFAQEYTSECEMVDADDNLIEIKGFGEGVIDAE